MTGEVKAAPGGADLGRLFADVSAAYEEPGANHIDLQDCFVETVQVVSAISGTKPSFIGVAVTPERREHFARIRDICDAAGVGCGFGDVVITHLYRPLAIPREDVVQAMMQRIEADRAPIFWISAHSGLASAYEEADIAALDDAERLGIPRCCATWHFDCFYARQAEAFADVYLKQEAVDEICSWIASDWHFGVGSFLPNSPLKAAILRSNIAFPFVDHVACPACLASRSTSPSALVSAANSALGRQYDPATHAAVLSDVQGFGARVTAMSAGFRYELVEYADDHCRNGRARDACIRHGRYLLKALAL